MTLRIAIRPAVLFWLVIAPFASADRPERLSLEAYSELINHYQRGDFSEAAGTLSQLPRESFQDAAKDYGKRPLSDHQRMVAILLHTEAVLLSRREESYHLKAVRRYLEGIDDSESRRAFMRKWFLALSHGYRKSLRYDSAVPLLEAARKAFPEDLEIRMAIASAWEVEGCSGKDRLLDRADKEYRKIIEIQPGHVEAHLRLARVLQLRSRMGEAIGEAQWVLDHAIDARTKLIAYIVLGNIHNQRAELSEEIAAFRAATEIDPHSQVAALALSHALQRSGDPVASRQVMEKLLLGAEPMVDHPDEWWRFKLVVDHESLLDEMREELCR